MNQNRTGIRLFIPDLPDTADAMVAGGVYAMIADTPPARFPLLGTALQGNYLQRTPATLLVATDPKTFLERLSAVGFAEQSTAVETGRLSVFQLQDDFNKNLFRFGIDAFTSELDYFGLAKNGFLVIDQADELFSLHDMSQAQAQAEGLSQWARRCGITVLLVFTRAAAVPSALAVLNGLMDYLCGIVRLGGHQDGLDLTFEYWQSPEGTVAAKVFHLNMLDNGQYQVKKHDGNPGSAGTEDGLIESPSPADQHFLFINPALSQIGQQMPGHWQQCESVIGMLRLAHNQVAVNVLLSFERQTSVRDLAEAVHSLRLALGKRARIVIFESDSSLRYQNEILLLRLGANLIVHRDVPPIRIPLMLDSLRGQLFTRDVEMHFEEALASVTASNKRGYLPKQVFSSECQAIIDRAELLDLPCALVRAKVKVDKTPSEVLAELQINRPGDLTTDDGEYCYLFFSGCPQASLEQAMQAVTKANVGNMFTHVHYWVARSEVRSMLQVLAPIDVPSKAATTQRQIPGVAPMAVERPAPTERSTTVPVILRVVPSALQSIASESAQEETTPLAAVNSQADSSFRRPAGTVSPLRRMVAQRITKTQANAE